jgi:hypothetical protein
MTTLEAQAYVRVVIRSHTHRSPHNLTYGCSRLTTQSIRCRPGWTDKVYIYAAAVTFGLEPRAGQEYVTGTLSGLRATTRACLARASVRSCAHSFRWAV